MATARPAATLLGRFYSERNREVRLDRPVTSLGRAPGNVLVLRDDRVRDEHARVVREGDRYWAEAAADAAVWVNGDALEPGTRRELRPGDLLRIAHLEFEFRAPEPAGPAAPALRVTGGVHAGKLFRLPGPRAAVGRAPENDVQFPDRSVSRRHCVILRLGCGWVVEDLASTNGTLVNGEYVRCATPLRDGDEVVLGYSRFVFEDAVARTRVWRRWVRWSARTLALCAALAVATPAARAQTATYRADLSFLLPGRGLPGGAEDPSAIAVDAEGWIHVADRKAGKVYVFDERGRYRRSYPEARDVLREPVALALGPGGRAFVLDAAQRRVVVLGPDGGRSAVGVPGTGPGQLRRPVGVAVDATGYVYVLDAESRAVLVHAPDGLFVRELRSEALFADPRALAVGRDGAVYVADRRAGLVYALPPFPDLPWRGPVDRWARPLRFTAVVGEPGALATLPSGSVLLLDRAQGRLWRHEGRARAPDAAGSAIYGGPGRGPGAFERAVALATAGAADVWILDGEVRKVERVQIADEADRAALAVRVWPVHVTFGNPQLLPGRLVGVRGTGATADLFFDLGGRGVSRVPGHASSYVTAFGDSAIAILPDLARGKQDFAIPGATRVGDVAANDAFVVVSEPERNRLVAFLAGDGRLVGTFGDAYRDERRLSRPRGIAFLPDGRLLVADQGNGRLKTFSADFASLLESEPFPEPVGVAVDSAGVAYAWSADGARWARRDPESGRWTPLEGWPLPRVGGVAFDPVGNLFVLNAETGQVEVFGRDGAALFAFGTPGRIREPGGLFLDPAGNLYAVDAAAGQTFLYHWEVELPPPTDATARIEGDRVTLSWTPAGPLALGYAVYGVAAAQDAADAPAGTRLGVTREPRFALDPGALAGARALVAGVRVATISAFGREGLPGPVVPVPWLAARAAYERRDYATALAHAEAAVARAEAAGDRAGAAEARWLLLRAAVAAGAYERAVEAGERLQTEPGAPRGAELRLALARAYLGRGDHRAAANQLIRMAADTAGARHAEDAGVQRLVAEVADAALERVDTAGALGFLRNYARALPPGPARERAEEALAVAETRAKLALALRAWHDLEYGDAVRQLERMLADPATAVTGESRVLALQLLSAAYYALGRRDDARRAYLEIFAADPGFDLRAAHARVRERYGLTVYNDEMLRFFERIRP